ncbi:MAG: FMN-binding protein [Oscillospiraceae bacterium]|nr:FMN-binding protein [Oscillospiraceae bacterium]
MKKESNFLYVIRLTVTLLLICVVMAAALGAVNGVTAPIIEQLTYEKTQRAVSAVLEGGGDEVADFPAMDMISKVYHGENGYAVEVTPTGFDNTITMMVGVNNEGKVTGISIIDHSETAGLGAVAAAATSAGEAFRAQFAGLSSTISVTKDGGQVEAITSATITSRAVCDGVNAALALVAAMG